MSDRFYTVFLLTIAFSMFVIAAIDLLSLGAGTCGAMADQLAVNCWGTRLLRTLTGWPTNVAAAVGDFTYGVLALVLAFINGRRNE